MQDASNFVYLRTGEPEDARDPRTLLKGYKERLEKMRTLFLYEQSHRGITPRNISSLERELLDMIRGIDELRRVSGIKKLLSSPDAVQGKIQCVITCLNLASDLLEMPVTPNRRILLYQKYNEIPRHISDVINLLPSK